MQAQPKTTWIPEKEPELWGTRIKRVRRKLGLTQRQLADVSGIAEGSLTGYESKPREFGDATVSMAIAEATGVNVAWLVWGDDYERIIRQGISASTWGMIHPAYDPSHHPECLNQG